jgi:hypothetical protein
MVKSAITPSVKDEIGTATKTTKLTIPSCIARSDTSLTFSSPNSAGCITALNVGPLSGAPPSKPLDLGEGTMINRNLDGREG